MLRRLPLAFVLLALVLPLHAQRADSSLSEGEIEQLREAAYVPNDRILVFIKLLDSRNKRLQDLFAHPRKPGREQDAPAQRSAREHGHADLRFHPWASSHHEQD